MKPLGTQQGSNSMSKSYLDAMKALQDTCKHLRTQVQEKDQIIIKMQTDFDNQGYAFQKRLEKYSLAAESREDKLQNIIKEKESKLKEVILELKREITRKKEVFEKNVHLEKVISHLKEAVENEKKSKNVALEQLMQTENVLDETKCDLLK